jgi:anthranilate/para-aminobenzoate synthase component I
MSRLIARELPLAPHPLEVAGRIAEQPEWVFLWSASGSGPSYVGKPRAVHRALDPEPALALRPHARSRLELAPRWLGLLPYEARRVLERRAPGTPPDRRPEPHLAEPLWLRLGAVARIDDRVTVIGDEPAEVEELQALLLSTKPARRHAATTLRLLPSEAPEVHAARVRQALRLIAAGQVYQVNLARRLDLAVAGNPLDVLRTLCTDTRPAYAFALRSGGLEAIGTSPELLLELDTDRRLLTSPIKGTRPRGSDAASDVRWARELDADPKERAELSMIVDVERNDLGRICEIGSIRVRPAVLATQGLVWHRRADVRGRMRAEVSRTELLEAIVPSGSVTGAPKVRAMEIIAELEAARRGLYTPARSCFPWRSVF